MSVDVELDFAPAYETFLEPILFTKIDANLKWIESNESKFPALLIDLSAK